MMEPYEIVVTESDEGFSVCCPSLPGCWSQGATEAEARANIQSAIEDYLEALAEAGKSVGVAERGPDGAGGRQG